MIARLALLLLAAAAAHANDSEPPPIKAQTDIVAALECKKRGFGWMLRLSREYVICLPSPAGAGAEAVNVDDVLKRGAQ